MRITADTNLLVRMTMDDDPIQAAEAHTVLAEAELVALPVAALCEYVWVLRSGYRLPTPEIARDLRAVLAPSNTRYDVASVRFGLAVLDAGGDFADGVIAYSGLLSGAEEFVTFDRKAARLVASAGLKARCLG